MKTKISNLLASLLLGIAVSIVGGFLQAATSKIFITIPWGILLYLFIFLYSIRYIRTTTDSRIFVITYGVGWLSIALLMSTKLLAGDLVLTNNLLAKIYLLGSVIILGAMSSLPLKK
jgi:type IV secretory pathway VirB3-like protein